MLVMVDAFKCLPSGKKTIEQMHPTVTATLFSYIHNPIY